MVQVRVTDHKMSLWVLFVYLFQVFIDTIIYSLLIQCLGPSKKDIGFKKKACLFVCLFYQGTRNWSCCRLTIWYKDLFTLFQTIELTRMFWSLVSLQSIISQAPLSGGQQDDIWSHKHVVWFYYLWPLPGCKGREGKGQTDHLMMKFFIWSHILTKMFTITWWKFPLLGTSWNIS